MVSQRKLDVSSCHVLLHIPFAVIWGLQVNAAAMKSAPGYEE